MTGTLINVAAVLIGGTVGALAGERLPSRYRETVLHAIGLMTILIGLQMALGTKSAIIVLGSVVVGAILGEAARIDDGLSWLGDWVEARVMGAGGLGPGVGQVSPDTRHPIPDTQGGGADHAKPEGRTGKGASLFSKGFVTASLVFCVGPMSILGSFQDGLTGVHDTLAVKSVLDCFTAIALASSLGWGVVCSAVIVLLYQGSLTMSAVWAKPFMTEAVVTEMTAAGGLLIVGIGLNILGLMKIRVANMLPALIVAPILVALVGGR
ncbi:MAG TPA: DUF554 domain-containing protein [Chloroflexota bacterium]|nr:DUF554 domain-containing protein [Chloroflexota bacterium]